MCNYCPAKIIIIYDIEYDVRIVIGRIEEIKVKIWRKYINHFKKRTPCIRGVLFYLKESELLRTAGVPGLVLLNTETRVDL